MRISRRTVLKQAAATAVLAAPFVRSARASERIVYATWGGTWEAALRKHIFDPFTKETGIEVVAVPGADQFGKLKAMVDAGKAEWDVVEVYSKFQYLGESLGLLTAIDPDKVGIERVKGGPAEYLIFSHGVPMCLQSVLLSYNSKRFDAAEAPTSWADAWDTKKYPGLRSMSPSLSRSTIEIALIADGAEPSTLFPLDIDRALASLDRIKQDILWWDTAAQAVQYMIDGTPAVNALADGRTKFALSKGAPATIVENDKVLSGSSLIIPKHSANPEGAMKYMNFFLRPDRQAAIAQAFGYGPVTAGAYEFIDKEKAKTFAGSPTEVGRIFRVDESWWATNEQMANEKFSQWRLS